MNDSQIAELCSELINLPSQHGLGAVVYELKLVVQNEDYCSDMQQLALWCLKELIKAPPKA